MASITSSRLGISLTWSLQAATHTRTLAVSLTSTERASLRRRSNNNNNTSKTHCFPQSNTRHFSTTHRASAENTPPQPAQPSATPNAFRRAPNYTRPPASKISYPTQRTPQPPPDTERNVAANPPQEPIRELSSSGLADVPTPAKIPSDVNPEQVDWTSSFHGLSSQPFSQEAQEILLAPIEIDDIEIKPDGILYLPEIKYRRILNRAFGPGGWGLAPRGETIVTAKSVTREYALLASGRLVSIARGEQDYFDPDGIPTATEGCKSNALMRCCKDLGVASELWDPRYIRRHMAEHAREVWVEHAVTKKKKKVTMRRDDEVRYPFKEVKGGFA